MNDHPGNWLREYINTTNLSILEVADKCGIKESRLREIINQRKGLTSAIAVRLEVGIGVDAEKLMCKDMAYKLQKAWEKERLKNGKDSVSNGQPLTD